VSDVTPSGIRQAGPAGEGVSAGPSGTRGRRRHGSGHDGERSVVGEAEFRSYYGLPVINKPVWRAQDIAGYLFLGGLAGASSIVAAGAQATGRSSLARAAKLGSTAAIGLSGAALVHDLGRPARALNMLRVLKPTSPMSVGSWLLAGYSSCSVAASASAVTGRWPMLGRAGTIGAATLGSGVATYTAALISDTAVPAWHEGYRDMPFLFAASAASAAAGWGMLTAPLHETSPVRRLGMAAGLAELAASEVMKRRMGIAAEAYRESPQARRYEQAARLATGAGIAIAAIVGRRSRMASAAAGAALLTGSALMRFAVFEAGIASAENPRYTVVPQRQRLLRRSQSQG
jgi:formate-dependent nitrite reductase membrane component NrfD